MCSIPESENDEKPNMHSKYDLVKIKVLIENHYYILSRYLISRILKMIRIPDFYAVQIAIDLKKIILASGNNTIE